MKTIQSLLILAVAGVLFASCSGGSFQKAKSGLLYKIVSGSKKEKLQPGAYIKFHVKVYQKDSLSYNSFGKIPAFTMVDSLGRSYDISEVFPLMYVGDSAVVVQSLDTIARLSGGQMPPGFKKGDKIKIMFRVLEQYTDMAQAQDQYNKELEQQKEREIAVIEDYLKKKNITTTKTAGGTFVEIMNPGDGAKPDSGQKVLVKYTGMTFDGEKFDSNVDSSFGHVDPFPITIGQMGSIVGFEDGVKQLAKGGKAKVYIPSMLAYGMQGSPPKIKSYENLIFEIEVLDITTGTAIAPPVLQPAPPGAK
ncbi:MAG TPA: FKBP-type peptidyl-prolyl cis-trans isomerase [Lacibacter sp.]|nr:FKBP-type peptidyl-prolyl cis-trans isomerase [Lacibacter sp.]HMO88989.1 FKBP-type peptidyl-prolyl cis-trans isomerase [Lacibacter sp.]HMP86648.1 FKBP-type peptidyl-prolyl cis-trans isomerase [Lacibacter sp.]